MRILTVLFCQSGPADRKPALQPLAGERTAYLCQQFASYLRILAIYLSGRGVSRLVCFEPSRQTTRYPHSARARLKSILSHLASVRLVRREIPSDSNHKQPCHGVAAFSHSNLAILPTRSGEQSRKRPCLLRRATSTAAANQSALRQRRQQQLQIRTTAGGHAMARHAPATPAVLGSQYRLQGPRRLEPRLSRWICSPKTALTTLPRTGSMTPSL